MPAWNEVGAVAWAEFSRRADLGNGLILYPFEAIEGALLTPAAAGGLAFTAMAAPIMLGVRGVSDPAALRRAFEGFWYWGDWRALCQALAFLAQLAASALLLRGDRARHP
jgi:hypothetical protein